MGILLGPNYTVSQSDDLECEVAKSWKSFKGVQFGIKLIIFIIGLSVVWNPKNVCLEQKKRIFLYIFRYYFIEIRTHLSIKRKM